MSELPLLLGRSQALRTNWCWYRPAKLLVDAGDGCAIDLADLIGSPAMLALTHGHSDHVLGLLNVVLSRQMPSLVSGGPLTIYYPTGTPQVESLRATMASLWPFTPFDRITWVALDAGATVPLGRTRRLATFATQHVRQALTLGYAVLEQRTRLPRALAGRSPAEIQAIVAREGREATRETFDVLDFLHTGDTMPIALPFLEAATPATTFILDCTFLDAADRDDPTHACLDEVLAMVPSHVPGRRVLHHLSQRYDRSTLVSDLVARLTAAGADLTQFTLWDDTAWIPLDGAVAPTSPIGSGAVRRSVLTPP